MLSKISYWHTLQAAAKQSLTPAQDPAPCDVSCRDLDPDTAVEVFEAALPPLVAAIFETSSIAPVTGDAQADTNNNVNAVEAIPGAVEAAQAGYAGSRKMLQI